MKKRKFQILDLTTMVSIDQQEVKYANCNPKNFFFIFLPTPTTRVSRILPGMYRCICSRIEDRDKRLEELKVMLLEREYKLNVINAAIRKAKEIPRQEALNKVVRDK